MPNSRLKPNQSKETDIAAPAQFDYTSHVMKWANFCAQLIEDITGGVLGFIPNGLENIYSLYLTRIPLLGHVLKFKWIQGCFNLLSGILIGQVIARDMARFIGRPLGFILGVFIGSSILIKFSPKQEYHNQIGHLLYRISPQSMSGALISGLGLIFFHLICPQWHLSVSTIVIGLSVGALLGLSSQALFILATHAVKATQAASSRVNAERAKQFSVQLKRLAKDKMRSEVKAQALKLIEQVHGVKERDYKAFFEKHLIDISKGLDKKIDRHLNLLTSRAIHGDFSALKKLALMCPQNEKPALELEQFLKRILSSRTQFEIQDATDTYYDYWVYDSLKS